VSKLERFRVLGLHGNKSVDISIQNNTLVLVGENGSGKTTLLRILFHFLSGRWLSLVQFRFNSIIATVDGSEYTVSHEQIVKSFKKLDNRFLAELPVSLRRRVLELLEQGDVERIVTELRRAGNRYSIPPEVLFRQLDFFEENSKDSQKRDIQDSIKRIQSAISAQILYLPTYRRIERELSSIFEGIDSDDFRRHRHRTHNVEGHDAYIELVEFGMKDVQEALARALDGLKEFARENLNSLTLKYLGDVVNRDYDKVGMTNISGIPEDTVQTVLGRIHDNILSQSHKDHVRSVIQAARVADTLTEHDKIICHYFLKLLEFQQLLQARESQVSAFCDLCSEYIVDKRFAYDSEAFSFSIIPKHGRKSERPIELSDLSSGEKQIVSLFSHLYLSGKQDFFVIIDEPELSLSVPWQRRFLLDIQAGRFCRGLIAATHSPFVYDNSLRTYTHALGEFVSL
jgi:ABC-type transport system involved in cytochrome c biogenesis ATPase subunit